MAAQRAQDVTHIEARREGYNCHLQVEGRADSGAAELALQPRPSNGGAPEDGILDLDLVTVGAGEGGAGTAEIDLENLENFWGEGGHPLKGVRVHAETNAREVSFA